MAAGSVENAPTRRARRSYVNGVLTREAIIESALEVFAQTGYRSGSLRAIAGQVGISQASILHHFRSKDDLLEAVLLRREEFARDVAFGDPEADLFSSIMRLVAYLPTEPGIVQLYITLAGEATAPDHPWHGYFMERRDEYRTLVADYLRRADGEGRYRAALSYPDAASSVIALLDGIQLQWLLRPTEIDMAAIMRHHLSLLVEFDEDPGAEPVRPG